ncbi:MAG: glycine--tRNA ligase subunit beta [Nitrospirae bacterium]|nr:glycine--tRNA ligase subunit beta [Nitrospirota bacterium]
MNNTDPEQTLPLLLEIGTEEIPSRFLPWAISELNNIASTLFAEYRISCREISTYATPRRLSLLVAGVPSVQGDIVKEVFGPSKSVAFDEQGNPTKAAIGFAASLNIRPSDLVIKKKGKGDYVAAVIEEKGLETKTILPELLEKIINSLRFPKAMRWGHGSFTFVRPIHWFVTLFGAEVIPIEIDGIKSGNTTRGHRFLSPAAFQIREISSYMSLLENNFVILDQEKRRTLILRGLDDLASQARGQAVHDEDLLDIVNYLIEYPSPVLCGFSAEYLKLPKELLITVMKDHQKYFAVQDGKGDLMNNFIVISNTLDENSETVRTGAERVIRARFDDANFYFHDDRKKTLNDRVEELKQVTFHDELGSLFAKAERLASNAAFLAERLNPGISEKLVRAAWLAKTDLITGVVREFPELQGIMGRYYAVLDGEDRLIPQALEEQYLPKSFGAKLPETEMGALLSLADRIDNIAAFFSIGLVPTGSEDPFALRRQAMGVIAVMIDRKLAITLKELCEKAIQNLSGIKVKENALESILAFMEQRIEFILSSMGYAQDLIRSVLSLAHISPMASVRERLDALTKFRAEAVFPDFLMAIKRVNNIVPKSPLPEIRPDLLQQEEEKNLYSSFSETQDRMAKLISEGDFPAALSVFAGMTGPINAFFDKVLVMDKQEEVKLNRLSLLKALWETAASISDFSKLAS